MGEGPQEREGEEEEQERDDGHPEDAKDVVLNSYFIRWKAGCALVLRIQYTLSCSFCHGLSLYVHRHINYSTVII